MGHCCHECEVLKDFYWLKVNQFLIATRPGAGASSGDLPAVSDEEIQILHEEALQALSGLIRHWKACYGLSDADQEALELSGQEYRGDYAA